jgi:streptogramin lyase
MTGKLVFRVVLPLVLVSLAVVLGITTNARADLAGSEAGLNPNGRAFEINPDDIGILWITDSKASEVWGVDPSSGAYTVFPVGGSPIDAHRSGDWLWWADFNTNALGRVNTSTSAFSLWQVPGAINFSGTNLDTQGRLYVTDSTNPNLYRLDPAQAELCTFALPGTGYYIVRDADYLWLASNTVIMRLQISNNSLTTWSLPVGSSPLGLAVDVLGNLWYADDSKVVIAQLDPNTNQLTSYAIPNGGPPRMVAIQSGFIWYTTEQSPANIGRLDPLAASHTVFNPTVQSPTINPVCNPISPSSTGTLTSTTGNLSWTNSTYPTILNTGGWKIYQAPVGSIPWGITLPALGYVVDLGRQELIRFTPPTTLIVIKHMINNNLGTAIASDFTMTVDNPGATPPSLPGAESPGTEVIVNPGAYSVSETGPSGYTASNSAACTGTMIIGQTKTCTITNDDIPPQLFLPIIRR